MHKNLHLRGVADIYVIGIVVGGFGFWQTCSGFKIGPDTMLTADYCFYDNNRFRGAKGSHRIFLECYQKTIQIIWQGTT